MRLTDDELRDVLARAEEIQRASRHGPAWNAEVAAVISAAEEVGLSRHAVELALSERLNLPAAPPSVGSLAGKPKETSSTSRGSRLGRRCSRTFPGSEYRSLDSCDPRYSGEEVWGPWCDVAPLL